MHRQNWDDLKFVLAVAETGSVSAASRALGVTHSTVLRRIAGFEDRCGEPIFRKDASGYTVLPDMRRVLEAVQEVENGVFAVERLLLGSDKKLKGLVRITSTDTLCQSVLPQIMVAIAAKYPDLRLTLLSANTHLDLERMDADIAVRPAEKLDSGLVGVRAAKLPFYAFCRENSEHCRQNWLGLEGALMRSLPAQWMTKNVEREQISIGADSFLVLRDLVRSGAGRAILPSVLGSLDPTMRRCVDFEPRLAVDLWVASPPDIAQSAKIRAVRDMLCEAMARHPDLIPPDQPVQ